MAHERPASQDVIDLLVDGMIGAAEKGAIRASAICVDMRVQLAPPTGTTDAIGIRLERVSGEAIVVLMPYRKRFLRGMAYGELVASAGERRIFTKQG